MRLLLYIFLYINADSILNKLYLSNNICSNNELITYNNEFYYTITTLNGFTLIIYTIYIIRIIIYNNVINTYSFALALVYFKYTFTSLLSDNVTMCQYEFSRHLMWLFATPLMLKLYCNMNNIKLHNIYAYFHIIPTAINVFVYPYKGQTIYYAISGFNWSLLLFFVVKLYSKKTLVFTNMYLFIWFIFMGIAILDICQFTNIYNINIYYLIADIISKISANIMVNDYIEREESITNNMDLQSIQFVTYIIKHIKKYIEDNANITSKCRNFIELTTQRFLLKIPENKSAIEQELLKKILPLGLDKEYYNTGTDAITINGKTNNNAKQYTMICILFTDIVNYTELAKKYDDTIIFNLLNDVYYNFDNIIKKFPHLQKVETIGDAYMVVGDIYRETYNHKIVIKEIILLAMELIQNIKTIKTPDKSPLSIRIGINMGSVSIGILGTEIPRLCVVGNAVNVSSRLQSTADPNSIQMSRHIYEQLAEIVFDVKFEIIKKENIFLKNIGSVTTYNIYDIDTKSTRDNKEN